MIAAQHTQGENEAQCPPDRFMVRQLLHSLWHLPRTFAIALVGLYQATLSPDHGPLRHLHPFGYCRHEPTCSEYGKQVLRERGLIIGTALIARRIFTCNPWATPDDARLRALLRTREAGRKGGKA